MFDSEVRYVRPDADLGYDPGQVHVGEQRDADRDTNRRDGACPLKCQRGLRRQRGECLQRTNAKDGRDAELALHGKLQTPDGPEGCNENANVEKQVDGALHNNGGRHVDALTLNKGIPCLFTWDALKGKGKDGRDVVGGAEKYEDVDAPKDGVARLPGAEQPSELEEDGAFGGEHGRRVGDFGEVAHLVAVRTSALDGNSRGDIRKRDLGPRTIGHRTSVERSRLTRHRRTSSPR